MQFEMVDSNIDKANLVLVNPNVLLWLQPILLLLNRTEDTYLPISEHWGTSVATAALS